MENLKFTSGTELILSSRTVKMVEYINDNKQAIVFDNNSKTLLHVDIADLELKPKHKEEITYFALCFYFNENNEYDYIPIFSNTKMFSRYSYDNIIYGELTFIKELLQKFKIKSIGSTVLHSIEKQQMANIIENAINNEYSELIGKHMFWDFSY